MEEDEDERSKLACFQSDQNYEPKGRLGKEGEMLQ